MYYLLITGLAIATIVNAVMCAKNFFTIRKSEHFKTWMIGTIVVPFVVAAIFLTVDLINAPHDMYTLDKDFARIVFWSFVTVLFLAVEFILQTFTMIYCQLKDNSTSTH
jgi:hypothetical protein